MLFCSKPFLRLPRLTSCDTASNVLLREELDAGCRGLSAAWTDPALLALMSDRELRTVLFCSIPFLRSPSLTSCDTASNVLLREELDAGGLSAAWTDPALLALMSDCELRTVLFCPILLRLPSLTSCDTACNVLLCEELDTGGLSAWTDTAMLESNAVMAVKCLIACLLQQRFLLRQYFANPHGCIQELQWRHGWSGR